MNKKTLTAVFVVIIGLVLIAGPGFAEPITIRIADHSPPKGIRADGINYFTDKVEKTVPGKVKFEVYWGSSLLKHKEMLKGVGRGASDMATYWTGHAKKELPVWQSLTKVIIGPKSEITGTEILLNLTDEIKAFEEDLTKWDLKVIGYHKVSAYCLYMTKPLGSLSDLKGLKVRAPDPSHLSMLGAIGATPIFMPMGECYTAMQRGAIDGVFTPLESGHRFKFHEVAKSIYPCMPIWGSVPSAFIMNKNTWNKLDAETQKVFTTVGREMSLRIAELTQNGYARMRNDFKKAGATVQDPPEADIMAWAQLPEVKKLPEEWIKEAEKNGLDGKGIMQRLQTMVNAAIAK